MFDLVIDMRDGGDWSLDLCFAGLVRNLGPEHVIDFPYKQKHREWGYYHRLEDGTLEYTNWGKERRTLGYSPVQPPLFTPLDLIDAREQGLIRRVWLDERMESLAKYRELGLDRADARVVVVAGHDKFWNHSPEFVASLYGDKLEAMLLDNWYERYATLPFRTRRIGWSTNFDHYWKRPQKAPEKDIDICFVGYNSHPDRARFIHHVEKRWGHLKNHIYLEKRPDSFEEFLPKSELFSIMQRSKICLNLRGAADRGKTLRAYEIPYVGSYMLSQRIEDPGMMQDFVEGRHCGYFDDEESLDSMITGCLEYENIREMVAAAGHERATKDLSVKERWSEVIRWLEEGRSG